MIPLAVRKDSEETVIRKLQDNLRSIRNRIGDACARTQRNPEKIKIVAVTKNVGLDVIRTLIRMGLTELGENRVQELNRRSAMIEEMIQRGRLDPDGQPLAKPCWHMIGVLQRNKVKALLPRVSMIHSVDRLRLAEEINKHAERRAQPVDVLLEVNGGNEPQKSGVAVCAASHLGEQIASMPHLRLRGLMSMAPYRSEDSTLRNLFSRVAELFEEMRHEFPVGDAFDCLSMGMSADFQIAVECGATTVRIGSALYEGIDALAQQPAQPPC